MTKELQPQKLVHDSSFEPNVALRDLRKHDSDQICLHCGSEIPSYRLGTGYCCSGCKFVYQLINSQNLDKFYQLKSNKKLQPKLLLFKRAQNYEWIDQIDDTKVCNDFSIEGIECTACVWLIKTLAKRMDVGDIEVNSVLGKLRIRTRNLSKQKLKKYFEHLQDFGYRVFNGKNQTSKTLESRQLVVRFGIVSASVMNSMMFSFAMYLGLTAQEPFLFKLFSHLNFLFCTLAVGVGGSYFFRKAWAGLKMKSFHFDLPVSLGILTAYFGSTYSYFFGNSEHVYFDTLCTFIFLMLLGRFLQVRWIERNRDNILDSGELESMKVRRVGEQLEEISIDQIRTGDLILISSGAIIPIESVLVMPASVDISQEWITGEADPVKVVTDQLIMAGSQNICSNPLTVKATQDYKSGEMFQWIFSADEKNISSSFWQIYAQKYSVMVISFLIFGFLFFAFYDLEKAIKTAVTISLVTCPCGIGIAIPMSQMVAQRKLLSMGIYLRDLNLLEHLRKIKTLVFDKTGTLTLAELRIKNPESIEALDKQYQSILFRAVAQSQHPVSQAIYRYMIGRSLPWKGLVVREIPGVGLEVEADGEKYFIGRSNSSQTLVFMHGENVLLQLELDETLLDDAKPVFDQLKENNYQIQILSGDRENKVKHIAQLLGLKDGECASQCMPDEKEAWIKNHHPESVMFLGDGLNDSLALKSAAISGVALSNSLSLTSKANFYFSTLNIRWLPKMLQLGNCFSSVVKGNLIFSILYNCTAVTLSIAGILTPLVAAIVMPAVSLMVVGVSTQMMKRVK